MKKPLYIYVDVDETYVRNYGSKRIPIPTVIEHIKQLKDSGAMLYCWSSGGADYAQRSAEEFGIEHCFVEFLPKPQVLIDDQPINQWQQLIEVHPNSCDGKTISDYQQKLFGKELE